jgi:hypothetical protein
MRSLLFILLCITLFACKKKEEPVDDGSNALYTFTNHLNKPIIVKIMPDSGYDEQSIARVQILPGKKGIVPTKMFYMGTRIGGTPTRLMYYWSHDSTLSNWSTYPWPTFHYDPAVQTRNIDIYPSDGDDRMRFFLKSMDSMGVWKYIDALDANGVSVWNSLDPYDKERTAEIDWVKHITLRASGFALQYNGTVATTDHTILGAYTDNGVYKPDYIRITNDCRPYANVYTNMPDRVYLMINNKPPVFLMAKQ